MCRAQCAVSRSLLCIAITVCTLIHMCKRRRIALVVAAAQCLIGMGLVWGATFGTLHLSYAAVCAAGFLFANSGAFIDVTSVTVNVSNWPNDRGSAVGVMKAAVGLSSSVYTVVHSALRLGPSRYLLLMMVVPAVSCVLVLPLVNHVPWIQKSELAPHGLLTTASRFFLAYQASATSTFAFARCNIFAAFRAVRGNKNGGRPGTRMLRNLM